MLLAWIGVPAVVWVGTVASEDNKRSAVELFARFSASDIPEVLALLTDDVTWRVPGKPEL